MSQYNFNPKAYKRQLTKLIKAISAPKHLSSKTYHQLLRKYPKTKNSLFKKSEVIAGIRQFGYSPFLIKKIRLKPVRTLSGVVPVTLLTKPYPCPGQCLYCPHDPKMPKSYLSREPGAQRAAHHRFDPYRQVYFRLLTYYQNGHPTDKVELIILGGTWSAYPLKYQIWFINNCFKALNDFQPETLKKLPPTKTTGTANWSQLQKSQLKNQKAKTRCVGLSLETRPDFITVKHLIDLRRLGCTKIQIGLQSLSDQILKLNLRGHTTKASKKAVKLLRQAGFKIQAHWMANLYGSNTKKDLSDFKKMFSDYDYRPDELKIYPTSLIKSAPLFGFFQKGLYQPYTQKQLITLLTRALPLVPSYCRVTRMIRDFSAQDIVSGSTTSNLRQIIEKKLIQKNIPIKEIRYREIRNQSVNQKNLKLKILTYQTSIGQEKFISIITAKNQIIGFLRLSLPDLQAFIPELKNSSLIREIHVYGQSLALGQTQTKKAQHLGLGKKLIKKAIQISQANHYQKISVISAVGTRQYYQKLGFTKAKLYQHLKI